MTEVRSTRPRGSATLDVEVLHDLLASSFELSVGKPRVVRRRALDTFDRRLERAAQRLQLVAEAGEERLELVQGASRAGGPKRPPATPGWVAAPGPTSCWPAPATSSARSVRNVPIPRCPPLSQAR